MQNAVVRFVFHLRLSNHVCPFKEAVIVLLMVMEEVWRILPAPQNSLSKSHIISVRDSPTVEMAPIILNGYKIVLSEVDPLFHLLNQRLSRK